MPVTVFDYTDFSSTSGLNLIGDAAVVSSVLRLTPAATGKQGACWYQTTIDLSLGFTTIFDFQMTGGGGISNPGHEPNGVGGDGIVFLIQLASNTEIHSGGQDLGYAGIINAIVFEFDTYDNYTFGDIGDNELAIHAGSGSVGSNYGTGGIGKAHINMTAPPSMKDGSVHRAKIKYDASIPQFQVFVDDMTTPKLTWNSAIDAAMNYAAFPWVGFTGAAGSAYNNNDVLSWTLTIPVSPTGKLGYYQDGIWHLTEDYV